MDARGGRLLIPQRVLLIEDDPDIQRMISMALEFTAQATVLLASDGSTGLTVARQEQPGLILLDVMLPDTDGYQVCRTLKADPVTASIPVVFLSARAQQAEIQHSFTLGAAGFLVKPFDPMSLAEEIARVLAAGHDGGGRS